MSLPDGERPEIAMVSRIRVEVRAESLAEAENVAFFMLDHAHQAGMLEGYIAPGGKYTDHFFNRPEVLDSKAEPWGELGLGYYGRLTFESDPAAVFGGLKQFGFDVAQVAEPGDPMPLPPVSEHGFIVLGRQRPVSREHSWEVSPLRTSFGETGESILEDIRSIREVRGVEARIDKQGVGVHVHMDGWEDVHESGKTLYEATASARKAVLVMLEAAERGEEIAPL